MVSEAGNWGILDKSAGKEPEMIDFGGDTLYYMDGSGTVCKVEFC